MTNSKESIARLTTEEFNDLIKVIRMLYGVQAATMIFEKNAKEFYNFSDQSIKGLQKIATSYKIKPPRDTKKIEVING